VANQQGFWSSRAVKVRQSTDEFVCEAQPCRRLANDGGDDHGLSDGDRWQRVLVDLMDSVVDEPIARDSHEDEYVYSEIEGSGRKDGEASPPCRGECAGGDEDESAMEFGLLAPQDGEREGGSEAEHVKERHESENLGVFLMQHVAIEARHD
jgi:hypothetical protein